MPLTIYNKQINKISGPAALRILRPDKTKFDYYKKIGMNLPVYILFGDVHGSFENMCEVCECKDGLSSCCYKVYDPNFMRLIDKIVSPGHSVDFYMEGWGSHLKDDEYKLDLQELQTTFPGPLPMLREAYTTCYNRNLRETTKYLDGCPTKRIRWHSVDIRQTYDPYYDLTYYEDRKYTSHYKEKHNKYTFELFCTVLIMNLPHDELLMLLYLNDINDQINQVKKVFRFINRHYTKEQVFKYCNVLDKIIDGDRNALISLEPNESLIIKI